MTQDNPPPASPIESEEPPSPRAQISALVSDVRQLAQAEWEYARARLSYSGGVVRKAGLYALLSVLSLSAAAIALVLGILLIISSYAGPWVATIAVVIAFGLVSVIFAFFARKTARNLSFVEDDNHDG